MSLEAQSNTDASPAQLEELLRAAQILIDQSLDLEAVRALHSELQRKLRVTSSGEGASSYASHRDAQREQERLRAACCEQQSATSKSKPVGRLRRPSPWVGKAVVAVVGVILILRYARLVSDKSTWAQQHPEGNWISRFYPNEQFEGFPLVRYDVGVNADFGAGGPARSVVDHFSARWDTCLVVDHELTVPLELISDDSSQLTLDDVPQLQVGPAPGRSSASLVLRPGTRHLKLEFVEKTGMATVRLDGLALEGSTDYRFQRPRIAGNDVRCE